MGWWYNKPTVLQPSSFERETTMPLNSDQLVRQLYELARHVEQADRRRWLDEARALLHLVRRERVLEKLRVQQAQRVPWLTAEPLGELGERHPAPPPPAAVTVAAADGSAMPPDRHSPVRFYVLNTGWVRLRYGDAPSFDYGVTTDVRYRYGDLYFGGDSLHPVEGGLLSALMAVAELRALRQAVEGAPRPVVGLLDGTMILWTIQSEPDSVRLPVLNMYLQELAWFAAERVPLGSYISSPGSFDVSNTLRVYLCPQPSRECRLCHADEALRLCRELRDIRDAQLYRTELEPYERTCLFRSRSHILAHYGPHEIHFCYVHTGEEIARLEMPAWVAQDEAFLGMLHAVVADQCRRSGMQPPYPPALHEAHEQAVLSTADREQVHLLLEEILAEQGHLLRWSAKSHHKRVRGV